MGTYNYGKGNTMPTDTGTMGTYNYGKKKHHEPHYWCDGYL